MLFADNLLAFDIGKVAAGDDDEINQSPNTASTERDELKNAGTDFADIETVNAETADKEAKQQRNNPIFFAFVQIDFGVTLRKSATALYAYNSIVIDFCATIRTKHN